MNEARLGLQLPCGQLDLLSPSDAPAVFGLYERCLDYFLLQDGEPATPDDADELFTDVPPTKRPEDQLVIGYRCGPALSGVAQLLTGHPGADDWYLGFLLLDPAIRGLGRGRRIYDAIERWSVEQGARRMLLCVLEENHRALRFWRSLGFEPIRTVAATTFKRKSHVRCELARHL
jgi:ribosomal protein S18 acetylase RimI-like enzyme